MTERYTLTLSYCYLLYADTVNSEIFERILLSPIGSKDIFATLKIALAHDTPTSVNNRVILQFREGFIFTKPHSCKQFGPRYSIGPDQDSNCLTL